MKKTLITTLVLSLPMLAEATPESPWQAGETLHYTTSEGTQSDTYSYNTAGGEVTFNPGAFDANGELALDKTIDLTQQTTIIVNEGKTVRISGSKAKFGQGSVFGDGELVKSGSGTLRIRLNDVNRDIDDKTDDDNDFKGSVTVEQGTLSLFHQGTKENDQAFVGGGDNAVITVQKGALLELGEQTSISIPNGAHNGSSAIANSVVIAGGNVMVDENATYGFQAMDTTSFIQNAIIDSNGLRAISENDRANLAVSGIKVEGTSIVFDKANITTNEFRFNGNTTISNTILYADKYLQASTVGATPAEAFRLDVIDHSLVVYATEKDGAWGAVNNVYVDRNSRLQTSPNNLRHDWGGALQIQGKCTLDVADIKLPGDDIRGLAVRQDGSVEGIYGGETLTLKNISYTTDQLSGDMLNTYHNVPGSLNIVLKDPASALPKGTEEGLMNTVFTLTLTNFDSALLVEDAFGNLDKNVAHLTIDAYEGTEWYLIYGRYDKETNNSIFTFSLREDLRLTPEPATATLSLLALAALAARRKRK